MKPAAVEVLFLSALPGECTPQLAVLRERGMHVAVASRPERALELLLRAVEGNPRVLPEPPPVTRLIQFTDHGMDLELRFWIADPQNGVNNVRSEVNRRIWRLFRDEGITIPVTQHEVRVLHDRSAP